MFIKEYRIPLPLSVEEYKIAQLYMIAKKSREESKGAGSGVEIIVNEPYTNGPGGSGQFTQKIYHVGSHLPGWFKSLLPKSALVVEEEAWNAYPYTKTKFSCPFVEKFSLEIETYYTPDGGHQDNIFNLSDSEKRNRTVDLIDVVKDQDGFVFEDPEKEDPTVYVSEKTNRGPLSQDWLAEYWPLDKNGRPLKANSNNIMCAYKLCKVEFRYWGMQSRIERFIHDVALRRTMLKAHLQAWVWQDEWYGLTMEDIRAIEAETAELLKKTMHAVEGGYEPGYDIGENEVNPGMPLDPPQVSVKDTDGVFLDSCAGSALQQTAQMRTTFNAIEYSEADVPNIIQKNNERPRRSFCLDVGEDFHGRAPLLSTASPTDSKGGLTGSICSDEDDEFFDCHEVLGENSSLAKWSSMELTPVDQDNEIFMTPSNVTRTTSTSLSKEKTPPNFRRVQSLREQPTSPMIGMSLRPPLSAIPKLSGQFYRKPIIDVADYETQLSSELCCPTTVLLMVFHGGSVLDPNLDISDRKSDVTTFRGAFEATMRTHYPSLMGHVAIKCVPCPPICSEALAVLSNLSPYSFDVNPCDGDDFGISNDRLPVGTIPILATSSPDYESNVTKVIQTANQVYKDFLNSEKGLGFCGQVCVIGDSVGSILAYDALCRYVKRSLSDDSMAVSKIGPKGHSSIDITAPGDFEQHHLSLGDEFSNQTMRLEFDVSDFFAFGSPLGVLLAYRKIQASSSTNYTSIPRPLVQQMHNLFHPADQIACRIEPLLSAPFSRVPPVNVPRYQTYPMGDGSCHLLIEFIQTNASLFMDNSQKTPASNGRPTQVGRRCSEESIQSGLIDTQQLHTINVLKPKWWGNRRIDYALYCPEGLLKFPAHCLPHLFHASYWESADVISFILRQLVRCYDGAMSSCLNSGTTDLSIFTPNQPREKWLKKRTSVKIRNGASNHRANDVLVKDGNPQCMTARFSYGPLDMSALSGERVDVHIMKEPPSVGLMLAKFGQFLGDWIFVSTDVTDKTGRLTVKLSPQHVMGYGIYPVRMLVRGDHTMLHMTLAVVPPSTETVVFSIDGSFAASVSVTGKDPKVKPGAVDIVRHWQELGYIIIYVTGRPDMQLQRVVSWLAQHNFPHGLVSFADGFTTDPLKHKADYLKSLVQEQSIIIHCAYGSNKDISVYSSLGLKPDQIYIIGRPSKKQQGQATFLPDGYADHLAELSAHGGSRPAQGNARMVIPKTNFGLPGQMAGLQRRRTQRAKRTTSFPINHQQGTTTNSAPAAAREGYPSGDSFSNWRSEDIR